MTVNLVAPVGLTGMHKTGCSGETRLVLHVAHHELENLTIIIIVVTISIIVIIFVVIVVIGIIAVNHSNACLCGNLSCNCSCARTTFTVSMYCAETEICTYAAFMIAD